MTRALDYACIAKEADARLILLHVIESLLGEVEPLKWDT